MKTHNTLALALSLTLGTFSVQADNLDVDWNMSLAQVKAAQTTELLDEHPGRLTYKTKLYNDTFEKEFLFREGKLVNVLYYKSFKATDSDCASQYQHFKQQAESTLGQTKTTSYGDDKSCLAASKGLFGQSSEWANDNAQISLKLSTWKGTPYVGLSIVPRS